jgi:hypothetical protein
VKIKVASAGAANPAARASAAAPIPRTLAEPRRRNERPSALLTIVALGATQHDSRRETDGH